MKSQILFIAPPKSITETITGLSIKEMIHWTNKSWLSPYVYLLFNNVIYIKIK